MDSRLDEPRRRVTLPQRVYGSHWPSEFYRSRPEPGVFRGVASVPMPYCSEDACRWDARQLRRLRDGLKQWGGGRDSVQWRMGPA